MIVNSCRRFQDFNWFMIEEMSPVYKAVRQLSSILNAEAKVLYVWLLI